MGVSAAIIGGLAAGAVASKVMAPKPSSPPSPPDTTETEPAAVDAAARQRRRTRRMGGRSGTVLTGPEGVQTGQTYEGTTLLGS
jgi:hypothetical protein